jgi:glycosyltransferase involved in cell wall biosynthesis
MAIIPAFNEAGSVAKVIGEVRAFDPGFEVVVVDDGSSDRTSAVAAEHGARVLTLPFNLGIGGSVQTAFRYAHENGFELAIRLDGDGQHDASQLPALIAPVLDGTADIAVGSRYLGDGGYRQSAHRALGNRILAGAASLVARQKVTDPSSGFQALNARTIELFANDYPHEFPEVEATVLVAKCQLRRVEVPAAMRERLAGQSSHGVLKSTYFLLKVLLALFVTIFRRYDASLGAAR